MKNINNLDLLYQEALYINQEILWDYGFVRKGITWINDSGEIFDYTLNDLDEPDQAKNDHGDFHDFISCLLRYERAQCYAYSYPSLTYNPETDTEIQRYSIIVADQESYIDVFFEVKEVEENKGVFSKTQETRDNDVSDHPLGNFLIKKLDPNVIETYVKVWIRNQFKSKIVFQNISLPFEIAGYQIISSRNYEAENPGIGVSVEYRHGLIKGIFSVYVYNSNKKHISSSVVSDDVVSEFEGLLLNLDKAVEAGHYQDYTIEKKFVYTVKEFQMFLGAKIELIKHYKKYNYFMFLSSYKNHYVAVRITLPEETDNPEQVAITFIRHLYGMVWLKLEN